MDDLLTTKQLLTLLQVDRTTIYRMLNSGRLVGVKIGGQWRFSRKEVEALLAGEHPQGGPSGSTEPQATGVTPDILPVHCLQAIQNVFAEVAGIGAVTADPDGQPLTKMSNSCQFCSLIQASPQGRQGCIDSWRRLAQRSHDRPEFATCHAGLQYARSRIEVNGTLIAVLVVGQFYAQPPSKSEESVRVRRLAKAYDVDAEALAEGARALPVLDDHKRERITYWLEDVAHTFEEVGRERAELMGRLRRIAEITTLQPG